jgi:hypothetical protein
VSGQLRALAALPPVKSPSGSDSIGGWVGPRVGLDDVEKRKFVTLQGLELRPSAVQPVASRCTDCAILTPVTKLGYIIFLPSLLFPQSLCAVL